MIVDFKFMMKSFAIPSMPTLDQMLDQPKFWDGLAKKVENSCHYGKIFETLVTGWPT
jgi:hypothetical protein